MYLTAEECVQGNYHPRFLNDTDNYLKSKYPEIWNIMQSGYDGDTCLSLVYNPDDTIYELKRLMNEVQWDYDLDTFELYDYTNNRTFMPKIIDGGFIYGKMYKEYTKREQVEKASVYSDEAHNYLKDMNDANYEIRYFTRDFFGLDPDESDDE
jgi:hypothetical protein